MAHPEREVEPAALLAGWTRLARSDPEGAASRYTELVETRALDERAASPYALATALGLAWSRNPRALEFFARVDAEDFDDVAHEWHARAALWAGDWQRATRAIEAMPESLRGQNRWRYWAARAREAVGDSDAARAAYAAVVPTDNWYAVLSAARVGQRFTPTVQEIGLDKRVIDELAREPGFIRARELLLCDLPSEAATEWRIAYELLAPEQPDPGDRSRRSLGLAPPVDRGGRAADAVQRLSAALSAAVRQGGACGGPPYRPPR